MLTKQTRLELPGTIMTTSLQVAGIVIGGLLGSFAPAIGQALGDHLDYTLLALITLLFFGVRFGALVQVLGNVRFLAIALVTNFMLIPMIGYGVASLFLTEYPLFMVGLIIYFMAPCTDWFLGFTRLSGGNVSLGTALIPINILMQLLLYPLYLQLFTHNLVQIDASIIVSTLLQWFLLPLLVAMVAHQALRRTMSAGRFEALLLRVDQATPWVIAMLVLQIFAGNVAVILEHLAVFVWVLLAVFIFFVLTYFLGEGISRLCHLHYPEHALLTMTTAARNAPLMFAVTMTALPGEPLIYAALVIGMLVEFPHLTALRHLLLGARHRFSHFDRAGSVATNS